MEEHKPASPVYREKSVASVLPPSTPGLVPPPLLSDGTALNLLDDADFDAYSDVDLLRLHEELTRKIKFLDAENTLFESFLNRVGPDVPASSGVTGVITTRGVKAAGEVGLPDAEPIGDLTATGTTGIPATTPGPGRTRKKKGEKAEKNQAPLLLTQEQKSEIATRELEELRDEIEKQKENWGRVLDNYKAEMEEIDIRISETKKAMYEFKRDIVQGAINTRTTKVMAERVLRYFEDKIRAKDAIIKKTRLKNSTIKLQKNKLHLQLKQKEEMGEVLHAIDFDQLQIENRQYLAKIEERNTELLKLKMTAGNTQQVLNHHKKKLQSLTQESDMLRHEINQRRELLAKLIAEAEMVEKERAHAEQVNRKIRAQMEEYRVPDVMDYVSVKAQQDDLKNKLKTWERKVDIACMQAQRLKKIWRQMCLHAHPHGQHGYPYYSVENRMANVPHLPPLPT